MFVISMNTKNKKQKKTNQKHIYKCKLSTLEQKEVLLHYAVYL